MCTIVEVKSDTPSAVDKGKSQVRRYQRQIADMWEHGRGRSKFNSDGLQVFLRCVKGDELLLTEPQVHSYKFCPAPGALSGDLLLPEDVKMKNPDVWNKLKPVP